MVDWDKNHLVKVDRFDFDSSLQNAMTVNFGEHRCHTVSYGVITRGVADTINKCIDNGWSTAYLGYLDGLLDAVFPHGATSGVYSASQALIKVANTAHTEAKKAINTIEDAIKKKDADELKKGANTLIYWLNNSPDNLRPGYGGTNSSIQEALDLVPDLNKSSILAKGTTIVDAKGQTVETLNAPLNVLRVTDLNEYQVKTLLTKTYSEINELALYSSGAKLQSSEYSDMKSSNMTKSNPTHVAIEWSNNKFFLFKI